MISEINDINKIIMIHSHTRNKSYLEASSFKHKELSTYKNNVEREHTYFLQKRALIKVGHWRMISMFLYVRDTLPIEQVSPSFRES